MLLSELQTLTRFVRIYLCDDEDHLARDPYIIIRTETLSDAYGIFTDWFLTYQVIKIDPASEPGTLNVWVIPPTEGD